MTKYSHHVVGFFVRRTDAESIRAKLITLGLPGEQLQIYDRHRPRSPDIPATTSDNVLKDVIIDGAIGTAVGTGLGVLGEIALVAANVSLFVASPLLAPLMMLGWGASIGGFIGAAVGMENNGRGLPELIHDAISNDQVVLVAETLTEQETLIAQEIIRDSFNEYHDVRTV